MSGADASLRPMPPCFDAFGGTHWLIGASVASCAGCDMPAPIVISVDHAMIPQIPTDRRSAG